MFDGQKQYKLSIVPKKGLRIWAFPLTTVAPVKYIGSKHWFTTRKISHFSQSSESATSTKSLCSFMELLYEWNIHSFQKIRGKQMILYTKGQIKEGRMSKHWMSTKGNVTAHFDVLYNTLVRFCLMR